MQHPRRDEPVTEVEAAELLATIQDEMGYHGRAVNIVWRMIRELQRRRLIAKCNELTSQPAPMERPANHNEIMDLRDAVSEHLSARMENIHLRIMHELNEQRERNRRTK